MANRNRNGRVLFSANPNGSKAAFARYQALQKAQAKGIQTEVRRHLEMALSVQAVEAVERRFNLNS